MRMQELVVMSLFLGACGGGGHSTEDMAVAAADQAVAAEPGIAVVTGTLLDATADGGVAADEAAQNAIVAQISGIVMGAGDTGHTVFLGVVDGTQFLAVDQWKDLNVAKTIYGSASFQSAFAELLTGVRVDFYVPAPGYDAYGSIKESVNGLPSFGFVVTGTLAQGGAAGATAHNNVLEMFKSQAMADGDVAHAPYLSESSDTSFFDIDIWGDPAKAQAFYMTPSVEQAFGGLFTGPPNVVPYTATSWSQY